MCGFRDCSRNRYFDIQQNIGGQNDSGRFFHAFFSQVLAAGVKERQCCGGYRLNNAVNKYGILVFFSSALYLQGFLIFISRL